MEMESTDKRMNVMPEKSEGVGVNESGEVKTNKIGANEFDDVKTEKAQASEYDEVKPASTPVAVVVFILLILFTICIVWGVMTIADRIQNGSPDVENTAVVESVADGVASKTEDWDWVDKVALVKPCEGIEVLNISVSRLSDDVLNVTVMYSGIPADGCTLDWRVSNPSLLKFCETNRGAINEVELLSGGTEHQYSVGEDRVSVYLNGEDAMVCVGYVFTGDVSDWKSFVDTGVTLGGDFYFYLDSEEYILGEEGYSLDNLLEGL